MPSNFPSGFASGLNIRGVPIVQTHTGKAFWVGNAAANLTGVRGASDGNRGDFNSPFSTIDAAIGQCVANRGDIIFVKPGHAENIGAAAAIVCDIAGVAIIGLGSGANRPTLTWTAAAGTITVTAANVTFQNMRFVNNVADVVTMFSVSGTGDDLTFENCLFTDTSTILNAIDFITLATGADGLSVIGCQVIGKSASNDSFITGVAHDRFRIENCQIQFDVAQTAVVGLVETSGNCTNVWIKDSAFRSNIDGALFIDFNGAANSGFISNCYFSSLDVAGAVTDGFDVTGCHVFECYVAGEPDSFGIVGGGTAYNNA
jgi:hypothetical protein